MNEWLDKEDELPLYSESAATCIAPGSKRPSTEGSREDEKAVSDCVSVTNKKVKWGFTVKEIAFLSECYKNDKLNDMKSREHVSASISGRGRPVSELQVAN